MNPAPAPVQMAWAVRQDQAANIRRRIEALTSNLQNEDAKARRLQLSATCHRETINRLTAKLRQLNAEDSAATNERELRFCQAQP